MLSIDAALIRRSLDALPPGLLPTDLDRALNSQLNRVVRHHAPILADIAEAAPRLREAAILGHYAAEAADVLAAQGDADGGATLLTLLEGLVLCDYQHDFTVQDRFAAVRHIVAEALPTIRWPLLLNALSGVLLVRHVRRVLGWYNDWPWRLTSISLAAAQDRLRSWLVTYAATGSFDIEANLLRLTRYTASIPIGWLRLSVEAVDARMPTEVRDTLGLSVGQPVLTTQITPLPPGKHLNADEYEQCMSEIGRIAARNPAIAGLYSISWLWDPELAQASPRLAWLARWAPIVFPVADEPPVTTDHPALQRSRRRLRLWQDGRYTPRTYGRFLPASSLIAASHYPITPAQRALLGHYWR